RVRRGSIVVATPMPDSWQRPWPTRGAGARTRDLVQRMLGMMQRPEAACARPVLLFGLVAATARLGVSDARAETIQNQIAVFSALVKATARISHPEIPINQTVQFAGLIV